MPERLDTLPSTGTDPGWGDSPGRMPSIIDQPGQGLLNFPAPLLAPPVGFQAMAGRTASQDRPVCSQLQGPRWYERVGVGLVHRLDSLDSPSCVVPT